MTSTNETPPGGFPKSIHGYNVGAVDDYIRKINGRLESLLSQVQSESSRADQSKRLLEQMTSELETMRRRASDAEKRELTALEAQKQAQEEVAKLSQELKEARDKARLELDSALADFRQERDSLIAEERQDAAALVEEAHRRIETLQAEVARLTAELEAKPGRAGAASHSKLEGPGLPKAAEVQARLEAELEAQRTYARTQIELVVSEARSSAEKASERSVAVFQEQEKRVRAIADECEALVARLKEALEAQPVQLPAVSTRPAAAGRAPLRNDEPEEKRVRENREWRSGDWRSAS